MKEHFKNCKKEARISPESSIRHSEMFHCIYSHYTKEVKNLIWQKYYRLVYLLNDDGFAKVNREFDDITQNRDSQDCIKRTIT